HDPEDARADALGHGLDRAALAGSITAFENDADLEALVHHPLLELDELDVQARQFALVFLPLQLAAGFSLVVLLVSHLTNLVDLDVDRDEDPLWRRLHPLCGGTAGDGGSPRL